MQTIKIISLEKNKKPVVWCTTNQTKVFCGFVDYVVNNLNHPEDFYILDVSTNEIYGLLDEYEYMRKGGTV